MTIGSRIKARRQELGISVDDLASKLGKNRATVYRYESDEIENMPLEVLEPLAKALNVTPAYLMGWDDTAPAPAEDDHTQELLQDLRDNPQIGVLLSASKDLNEEDIAQLTELAKRLRASYRE